MRYGGKQYQWGTTINAGSFTHIQIALAGVPGTTGSLFVEIEGQIIAGVISLEFPFRLRSCHVGFCEQPLMKEAISVS